MSSQWIVDGIVSGCSYGLVAASLGLIRQVERFFDFSHAGVYTFAAYVAYTASTHGVPLPIAFALANLAAMLLGVALHASVFRLLALRRATPEVLLLASIGLLVAIDNTVSIIWGDATLAIRGTVVREGFAIAGARMTAAQTRIVLVNLAVGVLLWALIRFTRFGILLRAVSANRDLSGLRGIPVSRIGFGAIALASAVAAVAALNNALDTNLKPMMGFQLILMATVALIAGGVGSIAGAFCGGFLVAITQQIAASLLPLQWQDTILFLLLIGFVFGRPTGLFGRAPAKATI